MLVLDLNSVDYEIRPTDPQRKTMVTVFLGTDGIALLNILPLGRKLISEYFYEWMICTFAKLRSKNIMEGGNRAHHAIYSISTMRLSTTLKDGTNTWGRPIQIQET
jgi:hypothetical protein